MKKRFKDKPYYYFAPWNVETAVKCPTCKGFSIVKVIEDDVHFLCTQCGKKENKPRYTTYEYRVGNMCQNCERFYRINIDDKAKQNFSVLNVSCPYCHEIMSGKVKKIKANYYTYPSIQGGKDTFFGYELYFLTSFKGRLVWAINREHLDYLIDYINADLREKHILGVNYALKTASNDLPTFMKSAKNRKNILKILEKMREL